MQLTRIKTPIVICIFAVVVLVFFSDVLFGPRVLLDTNPYHYDPWRVYGSPEDLGGKTYRTDALVTYLPRRCELTESIRSGRFPLWNPYIFAGTPFFADPQSRVVYPISLLLVLLDPLRAMGFDVAIHVLIAMIGMYLFLRALSLGVPGSVLGAFAYAFSSFFFQRIGHPTFIGTAAWLPLIFYGYERARQREVAGVLILTASLAMGYLAGFPQVLAFGVGALAVYALYLGLVADRGRRSGHLLASLRIMGLAGVLSLLIVSVQLVPFLEFVRNSRGLGITLDQMTRVFRAPPALLLRSVFPTFFGHPVEGTDWSGLTRVVTHSYSPELMIYCGAGTLLAALCGLVLLKESHRMRILLVFLAFSAAIATSPVVLSLGYRLLPIFRVSRVARISVLGCFALSTMGAIGFSRVAGRRVVGSTLVAAKDERMRKRCVIVVAATLLVVLTLSLVMLSRGDSMLRGPREKARSLPEETWMRTHAQTRSHKLKTWVEGAGTGWWDYEKRQVARGLGLFAVAGAIIMICVWPKPVRPGVRTTAGVLLIAFVALDAGAMMRSYFISQPAGSVFETPAIEFLRNGIGTDGRWRMRNLSYLHEDIRGLPPNTNQIFALPSLSGQSTIFPAGYSSLVETFDGRSLPARLQGRIAHIRPEGILLSDVASVRYIVSGSDGSPYISSPVLGMAAGGGGACRVRMLDVGGISRQAICQGINEPIGIDLEIPSVRWLDFGLGFESDALIPGRPIVFLLTFETEAGKVEFQKELDLQSDRARWHNFRLDIGEVAGGPARIWLGIALPGAGGQVVTAGWSGLDLIYHDCPARSLVRGQVDSANAGGSGDAVGGYGIDAGAHAYELDAGEHGSFLRLSVSSKAREIPLEVVFSPGHRRTHWIAFPPGMETRDVTLDMRERSSRRVLIASDSAFVLSACRAVTVGREYTGLELVHDGDLFIYENLCATEKGVCVDREHAFMMKAESGDMVGEETGDEGRKPRRGEVLEIPRLDEISDIRCGSCSIISYEPERVAISVSAERDCYLLLQDTFYPGWKAYVDGKETGIIETRTGLRAVEVGAGMHHVVMDYKPRSLKIGLALTCLGLVLCGLYVWRRPFSA